MPEQTAALPLNGEELIKLIQDKLGDTLRRDCFLKQHFSYPDFGGSVTVNLWLGGAIVRQNIDTTVTLGPKPEEGEQREASFEIENGPPDELRIESGQDVPTITKDEDGRTVVKPVHYARKGKKG